MTRSVRIPPAMPPALSTSAPERPCPATASDSPGTRSGDGRPNLAGMSDDPKSFFLSPAIHRYLIEHGNPPDSVQQALIDETAALGGISGMQIAPEQGAFMTLLTKLVGAK